MKLEVGKIYKRVLSNRHIRCIGIDKDADMVFFSPIHRDYKDPTVITTDYMGISSYTLGTIAHYIEEEEK